ncbi:ras association domain-containing protein 1 isoform X1 [Leucoraja erinacea]|uniref:ras association domain-containing protein 1 isoform X1 n=1 Tax=Leucoraja erinaceus TaxID=7782 RepID=UPI0024570B6B|nr:ras association domain-containing protein 1 isoform X1 [Leucoraja erinacea]
MAELIELRNLRDSKRADGAPSPGGTKSLCRSPGLERTNAMRINPRVRASSGKDRGKSASESGKKRLLLLEQDPRLTARAGEGHDFSPCTQTQPSWCDLCGDFIWGLYKQSLQCANCKFRCHYRCQSLIQLDCNRPKVKKSNLADGTEQALEQDTNVMTWTSTSSSGYCSQEEDSEFEQFFTARTSFIKKPRKYKDEYINWEKQVLTRDEIGNKIREYNSQINSDLVMTLNNDGTYTGFIKVQMKLVRPISVSANMKPQSIYDAKKSTASARPQSIKRRTSFYLPKDTVKHLHISSHTKASEVIKALLNKFMVVDNPRKFALFERIEKEDQVYTRKISDDEHPLYLRLLAGPDEKMLSLVLKENETGEVNWDAFSVPELQNFLRILQREEEEHIRQMFGKYARCRQKMQEELANRSPG